MSVSSNIDRVSRTFSADRSFCDYLFASEIASKAAELLVEYDWAHRHLIEFQGSLLAMVPLHFKPQDHEIVNGWTALLAAGIHHDINLVPYFAMRGLMLEAGAALRRGLEHAGLLTHLWKEPLKAIVLANPDSQDFTNAFQSERDKQKQEDLKNRGVKKRFASFLQAKVASMLYESLSEYHVHGGRMLPMGLRSLEPGEFSCGFANRDTDLTHLASMLDSLILACQVLLDEIVNLYYVYGAMYRTNTPELDAARAHLTDLHGGSREVPSPAKQRRVADILGKLVRQRHVENTIFTQVELP